MWLLTHSAFVHVQLVVSSHQISITYLALNSKFVHGKENQPTACLQTRGRKMSYWNILYLFLYMAFFVHPTMRIPLKYLFRPVDLIVHQSYWRVLKRHVNLCWILWIVLMRILSPKLWIVPYCHYGATSWPGHGLWLFEDLVSAWSTSSILVWNRHSNLPVCFVFF